MFLKLIKTFQGDQTLDDQIFHRTSYPKKINKYNIFIVEMQYFKLLSNMEDFIGAFIKLFSQFYKSIVEIHSPKNVWLILA